MEALVDLAWVVLQIRAPKWYGTLYQKEQKDPKRDPNLENYPHRSLDRETSEVSERLGQAGNIP